MLEVDKTKLFEMEAYIDEIYRLESVILIVRQACYSNEAMANYYNLNDKYQQKLSKERNHYINLLTVALDKVQKLKNI